MVRILAIVAVCLCAPIGANADLIAARTLRAGTILAPGDLRVPEGGGDEEIDALIGLEVRQAVYVGRPVVPSLLGPPTIVARNSVVTMLYRSGVLGIRTEGRALAPGGVGEKIDVMNLDSRLTVRATVVAPGRVEVR